MQTVTRNGRVYSVHKDRSGREYRMYRGDAAPQPQAASAPRASAEHADPPPSIVDYIRQQRGDAGDIPTIPSAPDPAPGATTMPSPPMNQQAVAIKRHRALHPERS